MCKSSLFVITCAMMITALGPAVALTNDDYFKYRKTDPYIREDELDSERRNAVYRLLQHELNRTVQRELSNHRHFGKREYHSIGGKKTAVYFPGLSDYEASFARINGFRITSDGRVFKPDDLAIKNLKSRASHGAVSTMKFGRRYMFGKSVNGQIPENPLTIKGRQGYLSSSYVLIDIKRLYEPKGPQVGVNVNGKSRVTLPP